MTDALKMSELQRTTIEFERQRHLANWLIKSSAHMAKPPISQSSTSQSQQQQQSKSKTTTIEKHQQSSSPPPLGQQQQSNNQQSFFIGKPTSATNNNLSMSKQQIFTSQTNLPLQIVTTQDGHKPKLRRFNSHDTSANMFSVVDFENARLARRNEIERQRYKMNSLSSGGDCSTGDSKGSKFSNEVSLKLIILRIYIKRPTNYSFSHTVKSRIITSKFISGSLLTTKSCPFEFITTR